MLPEHVKLLIKREAHAIDLSLPRQMTGGSSGMDLHAAVEDSLTILPGEYILVPTGISVAVPHGYELQIRPRSGLAANYGIGVLNSPGTIDSDYRGEIKVILINHSSSSFTVKRNDRIAQMVLCPVINVVLHETECLPPTKRSSGGFGHTGK